MSKRREDRYVSAAAMRGVLEGLEGGMASSSTNPPPPGDADAFQRIPPPPPMPGTHVRAMLDAQALAPPSPPTGAAEPWPFDGAAPRAASKPPLKLLAVGAGALTLVVLVAVVVGWVAMSNGDASGPEEPSAAIAEVEPPQRGPTQPSAEPTAPPRSTHEAPAPGTDVLVDPLDFGSSAVATRDVLSDSVPASLRAIHQRVEAGRRIPRSDLALVASYARDQRDDPRPHVLLARAYMNNGWHSNAVERYRQGFSVDPAIRADRRMLEDLFDLVTNEESGPIAAEAIAIIYGEEALPRIDLLLQTSPPWPARTRLMQLQTRIERDARLP